MNRNSIPIEWLHKELVEMMYENEISCEMMKVFHKLIARWKRGNKVVD